MTRAQLCSSRSGRIAARQIEVADLERRARHARQRIRLLDQLRQHARAALGGLPEQDAAAHAAPSSSELSSCPQAGMRPRSRPGARTGGW